MAATGPHRRAAPRPGEAPSAEDANSSSSPSTAIDIPGPQFRWDEHLPQGWLRGDEAVRTKYGDLITPDNKYNIQILKFKPDSPTHPTPRNIVAGMTTQSANMEGRNNVLHDTLIAKSQLDIAEAELQSARRLLEQARTTAKTMGNPDHPAVRQAASAVQEATAKRDTAHANHAKEREYLEATQEEVVKGHRNLVRALNKNDPAYLARERMKDIAYASCTVVVSGLAGYLQYLNVAATPYDVQGGVDRDMAGFPTTLNGAAVDSLQFDVQRGIFNRISGHAGPYAIQYRDAVEAYHQNAAGNVPYWAVAHGAGAFAISMFASFLGHAVWKICLR